MRNFTRYCIIAWVQCPGWVTWLVTVMAKCKLSEVKHNQSSQRECMTWTNQFFIRSLKGCITRYPFRSPSSINRMCRDVTCTWSAIQCICSLQWHHNGRDGVSNHQPQDCLFNHLFRRRSKKYIKAPRHWSLWGEFTGDRLIPRTQGHQRGKCFHLMTSWWCWPMVSK